MDSFQRSTTAATIFKSGLKENVIPSYAEFIINHRIHPSQTCNEVIEHDLRVIADKRIHYEVVECVEPPPVSDINTLGYSLIQHTTR
jgi:carboxypeptidase PM20D1